MKVVAIVQARMGSTRLPNKVMRSIVGKPMIEILLSRLSNSTQINQIVLATSTDKKNDTLVKKVTNLGFSCVRGNEDDVLSRYILAAKQSDADIIVRITGDCPLVDPGIVDNLVSCFKASDIDYLSNTNPPTFPDGLDVEVFKFSALKLADELTLESFDREHVTPFFRNSGLFKTNSFKNTIDYSSYRWTVDEQVDFDVIEGIFNYFSPNIDFTWEEVLKLMVLKPEIFQYNSKLIRNEGSNMNKGQKLWYRAKNIIPGGNMLLSKRSEMFCPNQWPSYFSQAKGCEVWDLDGKKYIDMSLMGVGTNTLGYGHPEVDKAVIDCINKGNLSTLNAPEEVYLAEKLVELHPWSDMVRFARTGGEANSIAIRIARAASGKDNVAICGYHGWHDWYLSANLGSSDGLSGHLLPGLEPNGVPSSLRGSVHGFRYNHIEDLEKLISEKDIGIIKMEVIRNQGPEDQFLQKIRKIADDNSIILIFDECTSGFRESFGGIHKIFNVEPDIAIFGKTLGNGYAVTATIGRREIMEAAQSTFISSTFWTERIGSSAALKTLEIMEQEKSWEYITEMGKKLRSKWQDLADAYDLGIDHWGIPSLAGFSFKSDNALAYKTFITQEMLAKGFLAGNCTYSSLAHTEKTHQVYMNALEPIFKKIKECENGLDITNLLRGPICHEGFKRLN